MPDLQLLVSINAAAAELRAEMARERASAESYRLHERLRAVEKLVLEIADHLVPKAIRDGR